MNSGGIMIWDVDQVATALGITPLEALSHFRDGRMMGEIIEWRLARGLEATIQPGDGGGVKLVDNATQGIWRVRRMTSSGVNYAPQKMLGTGRSFSATEFEGWLNQHEGFIVADVQMWPKVPWSAVSSDRILSAWRHGYVRSGKMEREIAQRAFFHTKLF